jgi:hypothetical protein
MGQTRDKKCVFIELEINTLLDHIDSLRNEGLVTTTGKEVQSVEILVYVKGNKTVLWKRVATNAYHNHMTSYRNEKLYFLMTIPPYFAMNMLVCVCIYLYMSVT